MSSVTHLGQIARELRLLSDEKLQECLQAKERSPEQMFVRILEEVGGLQRRDITWVLAEQERRIRRQQPQAPSPENPKLLGQLLLAEKAITREDLSRALELQEKQSANHPFPLGEILIQQNLIEPEALRRILALQGKRLLYCPRCQKKYNALEWKAAKTYLCKKCTDPLLPYEDPRDLRAESDVFPYDTGARRAVDPLSGSPDPSQCPVEEESDSQAPEIATPAGQTRLGGVLKGLEDRFRDFTVIEEDPLGGSVLACKKSRSQREVFLRIIDTRKLSDTLVHRLRRDLHYAVRLEHPSIARMYGVRQVDQYLVAVLQKTAGSSLMELRQRGELPPERAVAVVAMVCRALQHAHNVGLVHADLNPAKILVRPDQMPVVTGFGLSCLAATASEEPMSVESLGTPPYNAPEAALGRLDEISRATDIYSLGAVLYVSLTGRPPFPSLDRQSYRIAVQKDLPEKPSSLLPGLAPILDTIILQCMEKEPTKRFGNTIELAAVLEQTLPQMVSGPTQAARTAAAASSAESRTAPEDAARAPAAAGTRTAPAKHPPSSKTEPSLVELVQMLAKTKVETEAAPKPVGLQETISAFFAGLADSGPTLAFFGTIGAVFLAFWMLSPEPSPRPPATPATQGQSTPTQPPETLPPPPPEAKGLLAQAKAALRKASESTDPESIRKGISLSSQVLEIEPANAEAYATRARLETLSGNLRAAGQDWEKVIEVDPVRSDALLELGLLCAKDPRRQAQALELLDRARARGASHAELFLRRAVLRAAKGDLKTALEDISSAEQLAEGGSLAREVSQEKSRILWRQAENLRLEGLRLRFQRQIEEARKKLEESLEIYRNLETREVENPEELQEAIDAVEAALARMHEQSKSSEEETR